MNRQVAEICDPRAAVRELEAHQPGAPPLSVVLDLDHEAAELTGLLLRPLDLFEEAAAVARTRARQVRLNVFVRHELGDEVDVLRLYAPQPEAVALDDAHGAGVAVAASRRGSRTAPDPSATPPRIRIIPASSSTVTDSPRKTAP